MALIKRVAKKEFLVQQDQLCIHLGKKKFNANIGGGGFVSFSVQTTFGFFRMFLRVTFQPAHALLLSLLLCPKRTDKYTDVCGFVRMARSDACLICWLRRAVRNSKTGSITQDKLNDNVCFSPTTKLV